ncbi:DHA2 family efflux MFS transporter permease subunit [Dysgonomonas sp. HDW5A]|uniref:DHA2 family efflux MFS transporter permease subunit n=1 Tax=Dysgonomonas sp. HDW5A TaxID=2714926 RepID=UPI00140A0ED7|nr:DHA2 family efflux MFS transporter permease subunit [Dysgonomonas sp. HDW5A]QIK61164.1 DHA2 family efflux MFS transporter permease subunit [Dysgonomonas sp. HDW5A]
MSSDDSNQPLNISPKLPWLAAMAMFMQSLDATILNTALPTIAKDLNHSPLSMQAVVVSYALTLALLIPVSGWLSDKYGTKRIFSIAVFLFTLGSLSCALSTTYSFLVYSRILQAIGGSMMVPVSRLALLYAYPKSKLLSVMNFVTMPGLVGPLIGPLLGGWIVDVSTWHWIFLINIPIGVVGLFFAQYVMPNFTRGGKNFDIIGFVLFSSAIIGLSLFLEIGEDSSISWWLILGILGLAVLFGGLYILYARKVNYPLINLNLFSIRTLRIGLLGNLLTRLGIGSVPFLLPQMLQIAFLHTSTESGLIMMVSAISTIIAKSQVVRLVHRFGYKNILIVNTIILGFVIAMFALPDKTTPLYLLIPILVMYGGVNSIQMSSMNTISLADLTPDVASGGNSLLAITQQLSMSFGVSVGALILRTTESSNWLTGGDIESSFRYTFLILGVITLLASGVFSQLKSNDGEQMSGHK